MRIYTKVVGSVVWWKNPRTEEWDVVTGFCTEEVAQAAMAYYGSVEFGGWSSAKISKSNQE